MVLTEKGFLRPTYQELLNGRISRARQLFGEDVDTSEPSILGKYIRLDVSDIAECYELLEDLYFARFPNTARGQSLDRLCTFANVSRDPAAAARIKVRIKGNPGAVVPAGLLIFGGGWQFYLSEEGAIGEDGRMEAYANCTMDGELRNLSDHTEFRFVETNADWGQVELLDIYSYGQDRENDTSLRMKFKKGILGSGSATVNAIYGELFRVKDVEDVFIDVNDTGETVNGIPPYSFECHVMAPDSQDQLIAEAVFKKKPIGIKTHGNIEKTVLDRAGKPHPVRFSKSARKEIFVRVKVYTNQYFEENGIAQIKSSILTAINNLSNGETLYCSSLYGYIHQVHGVYKVGELELSVDGKEYLGQDISVSDFEIIRVTAAHIEVVRNE